ncbi:MAG: hypothetical protein R3E79_60845 [Caldilineaceae bacterium]
MNEKLITEMSAKEFDEVIETFITRETQRLGEVDAPLFYEALEEIFAQPDQPSLPPSPMEDTSPVIDERKARAPLLALEGSETLVTIEAQVVGQALQLSLDVDNSSLQSAPYVNIQNNQIVINNVRVVIKLAA